MFRNIKASLVQAIINNFQENSPLSPTGRQRVKRVIFSMKIAIFADVLANASMYTLTAAI